MGFAICNERKLETSLVSIGLLYSTQHFSSPDRCYAVASHLPARNAFTATGAAIGAGKGYRI